MDPNYRSNIPGALRTAREAGHLSREELADRLGLSVKSVQNYESGVNLPRSDLSAAWCAACGYDFGTYLYHVYHLSHSDADPAADRQTILDFAATAPPEQLHPVAALLRLLMK